jgi:hypothetical protein
VLSTHGAHRQSKNLCFCWKLCTYYCFMVFDYHEIVLEILTFAIDRVFSAIVIS